VATLNIMDAVGLIHEAQELLPKLPKPQRRDLEGGVSSLVSVVVLYVRYPQPEVTVQQWNSYAWLRDHLNQLKEAA
jgi:hypothetical protein